MTPFRAIALAAPFLAASGCFRESTTVKVNPDGSGTVVVEKLLKSWIVEELKRNGANTPALTGEEARARAGRMGEGVSFVSAEDVSPEGWVGLKATYAFKDVTKLRLDADEKREGRTSFRLSDRPGGRKLLTILCQPSPPAKWKEEVPRMPEEVSRALMAGLKLQLTVEVEGKIEKTNGSPATGAAVTVYEADFDEAIAEEARLKRLAAEEPGTLEEARKVIRALRTLRQLSGGPEEALKAYRDIKGVKLPPPEMTLEFSPR